MRSSSWSQSEYQAWREGPHCRTVPAPLLLPAPRPLLAAAVEGNIIITNSSKSEWVGLCLVCINLSEVQTIDIDFIQTRL